MNYANIKYNDISNGSGVRTCLFVSGCTHYCKGCFNSEAWDFSYGEVFTKETEDTILRSLNPSHISGITLLGGEPMEPANQEALLPFLKRVREEYPNKTIWCYTGYLFDVDLQADGGVHTEVTSQLLDCIDILVDGKFDQDLYEITLRFRGSSNQRIIDVKQSMEKQEVILWEDIPIYSKH